MEKLIGISTSTIITLSITSAILIALVVAFCIIVPVKTWWSALWAGAYVSARKLSSLKWRKVDYKTLTSCYIKAKKSGLPISFDDLEGHLLAGGNVVGLVDGMLLANASDVILSLDTAKAIDLAGQNICKVVNETIKPKVVESETICATTCDGREVKVVVSIGLKANISKVIGGLGEDVIMSRVREGVLSVIGGAKSHKDLLQNPDLISKSVLAKGFPKECAFSVLSLDIKSIELGRDFVAEKRTEEDKRERAIALSKAEEMRLLAEAKTEEMKAKAEELNVEKLQAEAEIPKALIKAFDEGKIGVMDYYKLQNMIADTNMRNTITKDYVKPEKDDDDDDDDDFFDFRN
ncbi:MAG: flotillin-like FloA family protein [Christensenellales bacterium]